MPKISVIVPAYKVEKYIHRCIYSILAQNFTDFELILVDDGSPDDCGKICDEYAKTDSRIHVIHKENGGLSDARNAGIEWALKNSDSEWIIFIDSDDWIYPKYLEALYNAVVETDCEISICGYKETTGEEPDIDESKLKAEIVNTEEFFCNHNVNAVVAWGKLYKKLLFKNIRYPVGKLHEDEFTTYKMLFQYPNIAFIDQPLYFYFRNENSITKSKWNPKRLAVIEAIESYMGFFKQNGFQTAWRFSIVHLIENLVIHYNNLIDTNNVILINNYSHFILKRLRRQLNTAKKVGLCTVDKDPYFFEIAYPMTMKYYWLLKVIKNKINRE